jgi:hypothetical protein
MVQSAQNLPQFEFSDWGPNPAGPLQILSAASLLADKQKKRSDAYQERNQNTDDERNDPMPTIRSLVRSSTFLRCSDTQPEEEFVHRPIPLSFMI